MRLCLAGTESVYTELRPMIKNVPYILQSYYYFCDWQKPLIHSADLFLLDSGAFTFMNSKGGNVNWNEYIDKYIAFIKENGIKHYFELDIDVITGYEEVKRIRAKIESETGIKSIPVWHKSRGIEEYKRLVQEYDYIAIGGIVTKEITKKDYPLLKRMVEYAYNNNVKVHGLGFTQKDASQYKFYSVDSTSWKTLSRFGRLYKFDGEKMLTVTPKGKSINKAKYIIGERHNLKEWIKYQRYLNKGLTF